MSVYSELLELAMAVDDTGEETLEDLVAAALSHRQTLNRTASSAIRIGDEIAYDMALIRLCRKLGLETGLTGGEPGPMARRRSEGMLAERLPAVRDSLYE
ncbi:MAG: hypothetical protein M0Z30_12085 [Actinomycetota bacterium]|nr:hypothetical protein [Actinomycetota bacterium]